MNDLLKVKRFYYTKAEELGYAAANNLIQLKYDCEAPWENITFSTELNWNCFEYRIKLTTVMHPGGEMPEPLTSLNRVNAFYTPCFKSDIESGSLKASSIRWSIHNLYHLEEGILKAGMAYKTAEDATDAAKIMFRLEG